MTKTAPSHTRVKILDIIRGLAVLGILAVNIFYFAFPEILASGLPVTDPDLGMSYSVGIISEIFLSGKMRSLFALLFGVSSILILNRLAKKNAGIEGAQIYFRRLLWLMFLGSIHGFLFLFPGDILFHYGLMGMIAFPFCFASTRTRMIAISVCLIVLTYKPLSDYLYTIELHQKYAAIPEEAVADYLSDDYGYYDEEEGDDEDWSEEEEGEDEEEEDLEEDEEEDFAEYELSDDEMETIDEWVESSEYIAPTEDLYEDEVEARTGSYLETLHYNTEAVVNMHSYDLYNWYSWEILLYMVLGMSLFKMGIFKETFPRKNLIIMTVAGLSIGGFLHAWLHLQFYNHFTDYLESLYYLIFFDLGRLPMVLGYLGLIILVFRSPLFDLPGRCLQAVGRMALSNYLMQSIIAATIFHGFGLLNQMSRAELGLVVLAIWAFQIPLSVFWMKFFHYGPAEWIWRSLTYWKFQKMRRTAD